MATPITELAPLLLMQRGGELYKVSTLYEDRFTAELIYPMPPRTTVRSFPLDERSLFCEPSTQILNKAEDAWGGPVHR